MANAYTNHQKAITEVKINEMTKEMPAVIKTYFRSERSRRSHNTLLNYAYDLRLFFVFLVSDGQLFSGRDIKDLTASDFAVVSLNDIESFIEYIRLRAAYEGAREAYDENSESRKLSAIRSFYKYMYVHELIPENITEKISMPKIHSKEVIYLDRDDIARLMDAVDYSESFSKHQQACLEKTRRRDMAIILLLLATGIRESELVGIDIGDIDFERNSFVITRKGGNEATLFFNNSAKETLLEYLEERNQIVPFPGHEKAFFLSTQRKRISLDAVQRLVKKYALAAGVRNASKISPHKLRASFATNLYRSEPDIYKVSKVLGHKSVTTSRRYVREAEDNNRQAAEAVDWV